MRVVSQAEHCASGDVLEQRFGIPLYSVKALKIIIIFEFLRFAIYEVVSDSRKRPWLRSKITLNVMP